MTEFLLAFLQTATLKGRKSEGMLIGSSSFAWIRNLDTGVQNQSSPAVSHEKGKKDKTKEIIGL